MARKKLLIAVSLVVVGACSENPNSPDFVNFKPSLPPAPAVPVGPNPILGASFWVDPNSFAKQQADAWRVTRPTDAVQLDKIASGSQAEWMLGGGNIASAVDNAVANAEAAGAVPVLVAYNIPQRDCGGLSSGGTTVSGYKAWITAFANGLAGRKSVVILEPDALTQMDCLSAADQLTRFDLIQYALTILKEQANVLVYLDGGHSAWRSASDQANRLNHANIAGADGFVLNVSNFQYTSNSIAYGKAVSDLTGGKHFIIDTSRNGLGPAPGNQWCNPDGRALGPASTTLTADTRVDAYLWIKPPGASDGSCNGAPAAGAWWPDYALGLAQRSVL